MTVKSVQFFFLSSHSLRAMIVNKGYSVQSSAIFWVTLVVSSKTTRIRHSVQEKTYLFLFVSRVNETMRWRHKVNWTHSPALSCIGQKSAQLPWFERVQYLKKKSRAKNIFATVIRAVAKIYLCENNFGGWWNFNSPVTSSTHQNWLVSYQNCLVVFSLQENIFTMM